MYVLDWTGLDWTGLEWNGMEWNVCMYMCYNQCYRSLQLSIFQFIVYRWFSLWYSHYPILWLVPHGCWSRPHGAGMAPRRGRRVPNFSAALCLKIGNTMEYPKTAFLIGKMITMGGPGGYRGTLFSDKTKCIYSHSEKMDARLQATEQRGEGTWNTSKELPKWRQCISLLYVQGRKQRWDAPSSQPLLVQIPGIILIYCTQMPSLPILDLEPWPNLDLAIMLWFQFHFWIKILFQRMFVLS